MMKVKQMLSCLLSVTLLAGMQPTVVLAAEDRTSYAEGLPCVHRFHTGECYTDKLICMWAESAATDSDAAAPHEHTQDCYALDCPHERGIHAGDDAGEIGGGPDSSGATPGAIRKSTDSNAAVPLRTLKQSEITGNGYSFDKAAGELIISSDAGTTAWKDDSKISLAGIKSVILENGVISIGDGAFQDCASLQNLDLSACSSLKTVGKSAFKGCTSLVLNELPDHVTTIEALAFRDCAGLALTSLPDSLTSIGVEAFYGCTNLALTSLPEGLTEIPSFAFCRCKNLALTSLPDSITEIGNSAFSGCTDLALERLPDRLTAINEYAFSGCSKLKLTELPDQVTSIGAHAFYDCTSLALTSLPIGIESIGRATFWNCTGLSSLDLSRAAAPVLEEKVFDHIPSLILFVPYEATGYDGPNWPADRVVYGAALSDLAVNGGTLTPEFFPGTNTYAVSVAKDAESITITPDAHASEAVTVNGTAVISGNSSRIMLSKPGSITTITVVVKNDEADRRAYTIKVARAAPDIVSVTGVTLNKTGLTLYTNKGHGSETLSAAVEPADATDQTVTWKSSAPDVASVDNAGKVTAVTPGKAVITVTTVDGSKTAECTVTVKEEGAGYIPVESVTLDKAKLTLYTNKVPGSVKLAAAVLPANATDQTIAWNSSSPNVATVDSNGNVTAVAPGTTVITVTARDKTAAYVVTVEEEGAAFVPVEDITLDEAGLTLYTNKTPGSAKLTASVQPADATDRMVTWSSSSPRVATVDSSGTVTAVSPGTSIISATTADGGKTATCTVTVKQGGSSAGAGDSSSDDGPDYIYRRLTDRPTGVVVAGSQINEYAVLTVKTGGLHDTGDAGCDLLRTAQEAGRMLSLYDVSLSCGFLGNVSVSIPVDGWDGRTLTVARCDGGRLILSNVTVEKSMAVITADSLSSFALLNGVYTLDTLAATPAPSPVAPPANNDKARRHQVKKGETLSGLAQRYNCTVAELVASNSIIKNPDLILPGWVLNIP